MDAVKTSDLRQKKELDQLIYDLKFGSSEVVRSSAAGALGHSRSEKAIAPLIEALTDNHVHVRHRAAWALGEIKSQRAVSALKEALNDTDELMRNKAAEALGKIQDRQ